MCVFWWPSAPNCWAIEFRIVGGESYIGHWDWCLPRRQWRTPLLLNLWPSAVSRGRSNFTPDRFRIFRAAPLIIMLSLVICPEKVEESEIVFQQTMFSLSPVSYVVPIVGIHAEVGLKYCNQLDIFAHLPSSWLNLFKLIIRILINKTCFVYDCKEKGSFCIINNNTKI